MHKENFVLVVTAPAVEGKIKIIESILDKLVIKADMVIVPNDGRHTESSVVRNWCGGKDIPYSTIDRDQDGIFAEWCDFGVFFVDGPTLSAFGDFYRQALNWEGRPAIVIEVNSESKSKTHARRRRSTNARSKKSNRS